MKPACLILVLLVFVTGGQGDGGYNEACAAGDSCDDLSLYCDTSDANDKKCKCNYGYFAQNSKCVPGAGHPCHHSNCYYTLNCISGECLCDSVTIGYEAASDGATSCSCASNKVFQDNKCKLLLEEEGCSTAEDCAGDNGVECTGSPKACGCSDDDGYQVNTPKTACQCIAATHIADSDGVCKLLLGKEGCSTAADCTGDNGVVCPADTSTCGCSADDGYQANGDNTACQCVAATHIADSDGVCKLLLGKEGCSTAADCTGDDGVVCTGNTLTCGCSADDGYEANSDNTACQCIAATHVADSDSVCKLKLEQQGCSTAADCTGDTGVECTGDPLTCGCTDADGYEANAGNTACQCKSDYVMEDGACLLRVGKTCNSSTPNCAHGMLCDKQTSTCLCDTHNNYEAGSEGDGSCSCDTSVAESMTYGGKTHCGKKVGGTCTLQSDSDVCYDSTCSSSSQTISGTTIDIYGCTCAEGETAGDDGTCSGAGHTAVSVAVFIVGIMSSALF